MTSHPTHAVGLDLGSAVQRSTSGGGHVVRHASAPDQPAPVHRGTVADSDAFDRAVRSLVPRRHRGPVRLSVPSGMADEGLRVHATAALPRADVRTVSAPLAAVEGALPGRRAGAVLVVDLGAELTEVSWVEPTGFHVGTPLQWGVSDLRADLLHRLRERHGVLATGNDLGLHWAGSAVAGRCAASGAARIVRVTRDDVEAVMEPRLPEVIRLVHWLSSADKVPMGRPVTHLLVGGGSLVPDLRRRLEGATGLRWTVPSDPVHTVLRGLAGAGAR